MGVVVEACRVAAINLRAVPARLAVNAVTVAGVGGTVGIFTALMSMAHGLWSMFASTGSPDRAVVLSEGAYLEARSGLSADHLAVLSQALGAGRLGFGDAGTRWSREVLTSVRLRSKTEGVHLVSVRGMSASGFALRPEIGLTAGRLPRAGLYELVVGRQVAAVFEDARVGDVVRVSRTPWTVVGEFRSGDQHESGFLADVDALAAALGGVGASSVVAELPADQLASLRESLDGQGAVGFEVIGEEQYYARMSDSVSILRQVALIVGAIMAVGGALCVFNVMHAMVELRRKEVATQRALGFTPGGIAVGVILEGLALASVAAAVAIALAWWLLDGTSGMAQAPGGTVFYQFDVGLGLLGWPVAWTLAMALLGSLVPAIRMALLSPADGLRVA